MNNKKHNLINKFGQKATISCYEINCDACGTCLKQHHGIDYDGWHLDGNEPTHSSSSGSVLSCKWFHGVRADTIRPYIKYGILPANRIKTLGLSTQGPHGDSRPNLVYITSVYDVAEGFARKNQDVEFNQTWKVEGYYAERKIVLCMGAIQILRKDRNGDRGSVEVRKQIRPEYLRIHHYQGIQGLCWPLLWVAKENNFNV